MPSSPNYVRDIAQETKTADARGDRKRNIERKRARRKAVKMGLVKPNDGKDLDHKQPLKQGGAPLAKSNMRVRSASANRGFPRNPDGSMKKGGNK